VDSLDGFINDCCMVRNATWLCCLRVRIQWARYEIKEQTGKVISAEAQVLG
jgi:hypothetical protein